MTAITDYNSSSVCGIQLGYVYFVILSLQKRKLGVVHSIMSVRSTLGLQGSADMIPQVMRPVTKNIWKRVQKLWLHLAR